MSESSLTTTGGSSSSGTARRRSGTVLEVADGLALLAFVAVGLRSHRLGAIAEIVARNAIPLAATWAVVSLIVATYRRRDLASLVTTWAVAVPPALLVRAWWVGSPQGSRIVVFLVVGLVFTLLFLAVGRGAVWALTGFRPVWRRPS